MSYADDPRGQALLKALIFNNIEELTPRIGFKVTYPSAEAVMRANRDATMEVIEGLYDEGFLSRRFHGIAYRCPHDGTTSLRPKLLCPKCQSEDIEKVTLIEHLGHGHIDRESKFLKGGKYFCPVDGKELKLIGVDYRKPGSAYYCSTCNTLHTQPLSLWACNQADHNFTLDEAVAERPYIYQLNPDKLEDIKQRFDTQTPSGSVFDKIESFISTQPSEKTMMDYLQPIVSGLRDDGFEVDVFKTVTGRSGIQYVVDVNACRENMDLNVLMRLLKGAEINTDEVFKFYAVGLDVEGVVPMLLVVPKLEAEARKYAQGLGLKVVEGESPEAVRAKLNSLLGIEAFLS